MENSKPSYAKLCECGCGREIKDSGKVKTGRRKFFSRSCSAKRMIGVVRTSKASNTLFNCDKCRNDYDPTAGKQRWCQVCCPSLTARRRLQRYNLSQPEFDAMLAKQGGGCPVCKRVGIDMVVDHDHSCCPGTETCGNCIRGLLCHVCNRFVGMVEASNHLFADAMVYLQGGN